MEGVMVPDKKFWPLWCLPADGSEETAERVFRVLDDQLKRRFGSTLQPTPGRTGLLAWLRLQETRRGVVGGVWPTLPLDLQTIIRETSGQGRFECCPAIALRHEFHQLPNLYVLDMQFAYAAGAIHLQSGKKWRHESGVGLYPPGMPPLPPGWYHVHFWIPEEWRHVGILPVKSDGGWRWPSRSEMEMEPMETWASHHEVSLAVECGWRVEILERIVAIVPEGVNSYPRPLQLWAEKLIGMRQEALTSAPLLAAPIRNILLHAIGSFARGPRRVTRQAFAGDAIPDHELARATARQTRSGWEYEDYAPSAGGEEYQHPEWAALIWGWTRARLLRGSHYVNKECLQVGALRLPREQVVGFALDCIYATHDPGWPPSDVGVKWPSALGDFRLKRHIPGPLAVPRNMLDIYRLSGEAAK
jgi:hypothetical protein